MRYFEKKIENKIRVTENLRLTFTIEDLIS